MKFSSYRIYNFSPLQQYFFYFSGFATCFEIDENWTLAMVIHHNPNSSLNYAGQQNVWYNCVVDTSPDDFFFKTAIFNSNIKVNTFVLLSSKYTKPQ